MSAFAVGRDGSLRPLGSQPTGGAQPIHLSVHPSGRYVLTANWGSGAITVHPVGGDGGLGPASDVVDTGKPYAHMVVTDPAGRWVLVVHDGLGTVSSYGLDLATGRLALRREAGLHPGAGPRHRAFHPLGTTAYVANEADSTVTACAYDPACGRLEPGEPVRTVPHDAAGDSYPSAVLVSPDGRRVYVANRIHDSVAVLATRPALRLLATYPCGGEFPRDMAFGDRGRLLYLANERSDLVTGLNVDPGGRLRPAGWTLAMVRPTCVLPAGEA